MINFRKSIKLDFFNEWMVDGIILWMVDGISIWFRILGVIEGKEK